MAKSAGDSQPIDTAISLRCSLAVPADLFFADRPNFSFQQPGQCIGSDSTDVSGTDHHNTMNFRAEFQKQIQQGVD